MTDAESEKQLLDAAKKLVATLENGSDGQVSAILDEIASLRESSLFREIGKLTRDLHDTIKNFQIDQRVAELTRSDIPDAKERLNYVIQMTEEAANTTLGIVETTLPVSEELEAKASHLKFQWDRFRHRKMAVEEFRGLSREIDEFLSWTAENATRIHGGLSEVMMAQGFQDLTGQIIRRVISLVQEVEENLVQIIRISGSSVQGDNTENRKKPDLEGPAVPGLVNSQERLSGQDEVDDLLSSLGF